MPAEEMLSVCPKAIIVAKPRRESWAREEVMDALVFDSSARLEASPVRGIYLVYSSLDSCALERVFSRFEYSFINDIIFINKCLFNKESIKLLVRDALRELCGPREPVRLRVKLRGDERARLVKKALEDTIRGLSCALSNKGKYCVTVESFSGYGWVAVSVGRVRNWNYHCRVCSACP